MLVLRFKRHDQEYKTPLNIQDRRSRNTDRPVLTTLTLFFVAMANLFTKQIATISGVGFTLSLFIVFTISERLNAKATARDEERP